jgi:Trp operon repressor
MKTYNELVNSTKEERFNEVLNFVTKMIKNDTVLEVVKTALLGTQTEEVLMLSETAIIAELCTKSFISAKQSDCLIELAKVS